ncbi:MAG: helix-turn-helix domain-containing protein [Phycisphaerales bacterium]|nr:helix-turn-helix domain-containing protein [Phycisphaerales bacterium]
MAKPFYSLEEVCKLLGKDQDGVKALVRDQKLREFRDAGKVFFKADEVDKLAGRGGSEVVLESAEDELPSLDAGGGTSMIGLAPMDDDDDAKKKKEGTVITTSGIDVFDDDELEIETDPMAKTTITEGAGDQVSLEGTGSGSGLLDLTRESDDTSLGAELLDEIYPGEDETVPAKPAKPAAKRAPAPEPEEEPEPAYAAVEAAEPVLAPKVVAGDASEGVMDGLMVGGSILLTVAASVVAGAMQGYLPDYGKYLSSNFLIFLAGGVGVCAIGALLGWVMGRAAAPKR